MVGSNESGNSVVFDVPDEPGGLSTGQTPMEAVLMALASCTSMDMVSILKKKRQPLRGLEVEAEGEMAPDHPRVFTSIGLRFILYGKGLEERACDKALDISLNKYCPVGAMLRNAGVEIESELDIATSGDISQ